MGEFQQRWELRRKEDNNELDSSWDGSKSSKGSFLKRHKLVSLSSLDLSVGDNENPGKGMGKAKKRRTRDMSSSNLQKSNKMKRDSPEEVDLQKGETSASDSAPLDDLKNFMDSLLKDLKVSRENLLKWMVEEMQKLVADDSTPAVPKRRKRGHGGKKVQLQQRIQVQHHKNFQETVIAQQQNNFQEEKQNISRQQHQNDFTYGMRTQNCSNNAANSTEYFNALGDPPLTIFYQELLRIQKERIKCWNQVLIRDHSNLCSQEKEFEAFH